MEENTIWNHPEYGYQVDSIGETASKKSFSNFLLDPTGYVKGFWNDLTGVTSQSREFAQQEYLQDKMNEYNLPKNQMARMVEAGINPNIAAQGIAGSGSESAQAPAVASNTQGTAQGLSAVGSAMSGVSSALLTAAQRRNLDASSEEMLANANRTNTLVDYEIGKFSADIAKTWIDAGMDSHIAKYWSAKAAYASVQEFLDVQGKLWSISKVDKEIKILGEEYKIRKTDVDIAKEHLSQEEYKTKMMEVDSWFSSERKRIYQSVGIDPDQSEDGMLIESYANGTSDMLLDAFGKRQEILTEGAFQGTINKLREKIQIENEEYLNRRKQELIQDKEFQKDMAKIGLAADNIGNLFKILNKYMFGLGFSAKVGPFGVSQDNPQ